MYDARIAQAREVVESHNAAVGEEGKVDFDAFLGNLRKDGGTTVPALQACSYEDLMKCGLNGRILAKQVADIFREEVVGAGGTGVPSAKKASQMTMRQLVEHYDPLDPFSAVGKRLKTVSQNKPFIVLHKSNRVQVDATLTSLEEIKQGYPARSEFELSPGVWVKTHRVGEGVTHLVDENPLYKGHALRPDGSCDQTGIDWSATPHDVRQFVSVGVSVTKEISLKTKDDALDLFDRFDGREDALERLRKRYRQTAMRFDKMRDEGKLPNLKVQLGNGNKKDASQDPFFAEHKSF